MALAQTISLYDPELEQILKKRGETFPFGVASGDPTAEGFVIWTKLWTPEIDQVEVNYEVAEDTAFVKTVQTGRIKVDSEHGLMAKLGIYALQADRYYYYRFTFKGDTSPIGRSRTTAAEGSQNDSLRLAIISCSNYEWGYFNACRVIAQDRSYAAVIHLGDYIYEFRRGRFGGNRLIRQHIPVKECVSVSDYRSRYGQYRLDPDLAELHRLHPMIAVWDDHEFANDANVDGAGNHDAITEGDWNVRKAAGKQVWFEWLPTLDNPTHRIYRSFEFGGLASLSVLDGRMTGRRPQLSYADDSLLYAPSQTMLGQVQTDWLLDNLTTSKTQWQLVGNQTVFSPIFVPGPFRKAAKTNMDMWDGYPTERQRILDTLAKHDMRNMLIFTGDAHVSLDYDLRVNKRKSKTSIGREWVTPSVSSPNLDEFLPGFVARFIAFGMDHYPGNPHLDYANLRSHGFLDITLTRTETTALWIHMDTVKKSSTKHRVGHRAVLKSERL
jgi:alkaline phosphatase D